MSNRGTLYIISAPSGSGKTSLAGRLLPEVERLKFSVSHTTRGERRGEQHGVEYFFVSAAEFEQMIEQDAFLEWAQVYGNYYGTSRAFVESELASGYDVLLDIDIQGALKVKQAMPEAVMVFVLPPSFAELGARLRRRGLDDEEVIEKRLGIARNEIKYYKNYDYVVINRDLERSVQELKSIFMANRCRVSQRISEAEQIVATFRESDI
ncbi:MAG: guanylate kinase [Acidobacteriota bacterium]|nr:MAG: guanylate kinase [Acidobacteriota bacterium]